MKQTYKITMEKVYRTCVDFEMDLDAVKGKYPTDWSEAEIVEAEIGNKFDNDNSFELEEINLRTISVGNETILEI